MVAVVTDLFRYPVKSMGGEKLTSVSIGAGGIPGDRAWAVRDETLGGIRGAKRFPELMACQARYPQAPTPDGSSLAEVTLPSGQVIRTDDDGLAPALSNLLGSPVSFWPIMPADMLDHYRRGAPVEDDMLAELRRIFARDENDPLPDLAAFPEMLMEFESPPGSYFDAFPLLLMTRQMLDSLAVVAKDSQFDIRRFRPNILLDADGSGDRYPEFSWAGRKVKIGDAVLQVTIECPRCQMVTHGFDDLPKDSEIMKTMIRHSNGNAGVYAEVIEPGVVKAGDTLTILD